MVPNRSASTLDEGQSHGRGFRWVGVVAGLAVLGVAGAAALGLAFPGFVTVGSLALGLAGTTIVLGLTLVASLIYLDRAFSALDDHHEAVVRQQETVTTIREEAWERHRELEEKRFEERIDELDTRVDRLDAEQASLAQQSRRTSKPTPFGDIHEIETVWGITEDEVGELRTMGVEDTEQLWMANARVLADRLDRDTHTVRHWQTQAELMALPTIGSRSAQILAEGGVSSVAELAGWDPNALTARLRKVRGRMETVPEEDVINRSRVQTWIENARAHDPDAYRVHRHRSSRSTSASA